MTSAVHNQTIRHRIGARGELVLRTISGSVRLRGTEGNEIEVVAQQADGNPPDLVVRRYDGGILIKPEHEGRGFLGAAFKFHGRDIEFEIRLPHEARININSVSADVRGQELKGDQSYHLVSGDLELAQAGGRVNAKSVSGDMRVRASLPVEAVLATTSGDLRLEGARLQQVHLRSVSGDTTIIGGLAAGPDHRVETVSGDLQLEPSNGVSIQASGPAVGLTADIPAQLGGRHGRRGQREMVVGDGSASLRYRSMSGQLHVSEARTGATEGQVERKAQEIGSADEMEVLRALERGEIDVEEASRRLSGEVDDA